MPAMKMHFILLLLLFGHLVVGKENIQMSKRFLLFYKTVMDDIQQRGEQIYKLEEAVSTIMNTTTDTEDLKEGSNGESSKYIEATPSTSEIKGEFEDSIISKLEEAASKVMNATDDIKTLEDGFIGESSKYIVTPGFSKTKGEFEGFRIVKLEEAVSKITNATKELENFKTTINKAFLGEKNMRYGNTNAINNMRDSIFDLRTEMKEDFNNILRNEVDSCFAKSKQQTTLLQEKIEYVEESMKSLEENVKLVKEETESDLVQKTSNLESVIEEQKTVILAQSNAITQLQETFQQSEGQRKELVLQMERIKTSIYQVTRNLAHPLKNYALGKPAFESSIYPNNPGPEAAVDGNINGIFDGRSCSCTKFEQNPWWLVDLSVNELIGRVVIKNREDCCGKRLNSFTVSVSEEKNGGYETFGEYHGASHNGELITIVADEKLFGRYVKIQIRGREHLTLCEVQVFFT